MSEASPPKKETRSLTEIFNRFAADVAGRGEVCDMGCGPGQVARYLRDVGATVFGLDLSPRMLEQARRLNPDIQFREGNMMSLDLPDGTLAGIAAFYAIVNIPEDSLPVSMDFFLFQPSAIRQSLKAVGFAVEETVERDPYPPEVEHQSRRAYIFARKAGFRQPAPVD